MNHITPYVSVDLDKVEQNIAAMVERLNQAGIDHWPHIKTHKCIELAKKQLAMGAKGITCAKLSEAEVMAEAGIDAILIAFPIVGEENLQRLTRLVQKVNVRTTVDSVAVAQGLSAAGQDAGRKLEVLIEIDGGSHRGGVQPGAPVQEFARQIAGLPGIEIAGVFTYVGQIYGKSSLEELKAETRREAELLLEAKRLLEGDGIPVRVMSGGSTPSSYLAEELTGITEARAGNYIFGDMNAVHLGVYTEQDCALRVHATVVSVPLPGHATIDAGSKTLTSDLSVAGDTYGYIVGKPDVKIVKLNEEHGYLQFDPAQHHFQVGDRIEIIPNHSCVIPNLNDYLYGYRNGEFAGTLKIDARGKNY
ncbi:alanine racemase [Brevibacillus massiliensis]|uniref:alanine racemase n=1 Tax=Brevibacillus massiliensis TaxID=1118054 RepID=UPI00031726BE|nr:alanine racemase [Brevibacillus massiliensis]